MGSSLVADESLQVFLTQHYKKFFHDRSRSRSAFVRWFFDVNFRISPAIVLFDGMANSLHRYILLTDLGLILAGLVWIPYGVLISASMMVFNVSEKGY